MKWQHSIINGQIYVNGEFIFANVYIKDGKIAAISREDLGEAQTVTDATGLMVLPGFIDTHIHSRDPSATYKEDFYHSTLAAAMGGITTVFEMPNSNPPINNVENFNWQVANLSAKANVNFALWGISLGDLNRDDILPLNQAGVIGFKFFWGYAINRKTYQLVYNYKEGMVDENVIPPLSDGEVYDIFRAVKPTGKRLAVHAENVEIMNRLGRQVLESGQRDYQALLASRPDLAEAATVSLGIQFSKFTGTPLHILHLTSKEGVELIREAKQQGIPVTTETCPHYLFLTDQDFDRVGNEMKVYPLIKRQKDQDELWRGIADGTITSICSDHAPHQPQEKVGNLFEVPAGMCGVETQVPLLLNAVNENKLTLPKLVELMAENPAKQFNLYPNKGSIQVGADADFTIVDMHKDKTLRREDLHSISKVMAYDGVNVMGCPVITIVAGHVVVKDGQLIAERKGLFIKP